MSNTWIGTIRLTNEDGVYGSDGEKILNYNYCDGSEFDEGKHPTLAEYLGGTTLPNMPPPIGSTKRYKIIADKT